MTPTPAKNGNTHSNQPLRRGDPTARLQPLTERLNAWRNQRVRGQRIPEDLWREATSAARVHGLNATAAALRLNYYDLQRRLREGGKSRPRSGSVPPRFIELPLAAAPSALGDGSSLELRRPSGWELKVRVPGARPKDFLPLLGAFLRQRV